MNVEAAREWRRKRPNYVAPPGDWFREMPEGLEKLCRVCLEWWPAEECFTTSAMGRGGFANECSACRSEIRRKQKARGIKT